MMGMSDTDSSDRRTSSSFSTVRGDNAERTRGKHSSPAGRAATIGTAAGVTVLGTALGALWWWLTKPMDYLHGPASPTALLVIGAVTFGVAQLVASSIEAVFDTDECRCEAGPVRALLPLVAGFAANLALAVLGFAALSAMPSTGPGQEPTTLGTWILQAAVIGQLFSLGYGIMPLFTGVGTRLLLLAFGKTSSIPGTAFGAAASLAVGITAFLVLYPQVVSDRSWEYAASYLTLAAIGGVAALIGHYRRRRKTQPAVEAAPVP